MHLSIAERVVLPEPDYPQMLEVQSVFSKGFNILDDNGRITWVSPVTSGRYPRSIQLDMLPDLESITQGDPVAYTIIDGDVTLSIADRLEILIPHDVCRNGGKMLPAQDLLTDPSYNSLLAESLELHERLATLPVSYGEVTNRISDNLRSCIAAIASGDFVSADIYVSRIIGYGFGLTPSGDDSLVGALSFLTRYVPDYAETLGDIAMSRIETTTCISQTYLALACEGYFSNHVVGTLSGFSGDPDGRSVDGLLDLGHSSGRMLLRGIMIAAAAYPAMVKLQKEER